MSELQKLKPRKLRPRRNPLCGVRAAKRLIQIGNAAFIVLLVSFALLYFLHRLDAINAWQFPVISIVAFLGGGGLFCCLLAALIEKRWRKLLASIALTGFVGMNAIAFLGAYSMTHFRSSEQWSFASPKPMNFKRPSDFRLQYETQYIALSRQQRLETWWIPAAKSPSRGTILLFPGNRGSKSQVLLPARVFHDLDYDTLLVDFRGTGGSSGNTTTLGVRESEDVAAAFNWVRQRNARRPIALYGVSMGTAAILRAIATQNIAPDAILLELPYSHLLSSVKSRLRFYNLPTFPTAELIVFWGSVQHGINGFAHNPAIYAKQVRCPTLILQGDRDKWIDRAELQELTHNLPRSHRYVSFPNGGHQLLVTVEPQFWRQNVQQFLDGID